MDSLLTPADAMKRLNVGKTTLFKLIAERRFPVTKIGGATRISANGLQRYIDSQTVAARP